MIQQNLEYLTDQVKYTGFGETLGEFLKEKMQQGENEFKIRHEIKFGNDSMGIELNFKKSDQSDMCFFNSYKVNLQKDGVKEGLEQTFYINKDTSSNITAKEAYNLLEGRAVNKDLRNKEGNVYNAWIQMDFKNSDDKGNFKLNQYHQNYGYDLEGVLSKYPIKELANAEFKENLLSSLKKGNVQSATFKMDGAERKHFIEAAPHYKTIKVYDENMQRISNRESKDQKQSETEGKSTSKEVKQSQDTDPGPSQNQKKAKKKSNSI